MMQEGERESARLFCFLAMAREAREQVQWTCETGRKP